MKIDVYRDSKGFDALYEEWNALLQQSTTNVLFMTWEWQRAWWESFGVGKNLRLFTIRDEKDALVAICPLFVQQTFVDPKAALPEISVERPKAIVHGEPRQTAHLVGGTEVSDYLDLIALPEHHQEACALLLDAFAREDWQILDLRCIPAASPTVQTVSEFAKAHGWEVQLAREDVCPIVELPHTWEEYLSTKLDRKQRHELRRKMRRAEQEAVVDWYWVTPDNFDEGFRLFIQLHKASHPEKDAFMDDRMQGFFRAIAYSTLQKGWLRLSILRFNRKPVASYLCFDYGGDRLVYNSGFDLDAYADLGPGIVLLGYLIDDAIKQGCKRFDFLQGGERYKYEFGATDTEVLRLFIRR